jgi:dihydrofolate synthase/folylpolyglutamate synthase
MRSGLLKTKWKGRLEVLSKDPIFLIDGAHNLQGITYLADAVRMFPYKRLILGMSVLKDKDYTHMIEKLVPLADEVVVTEVNMPRKLPAELLGEEVGRITENVHVEKTIEGAVKKSIELAQPDDMILFGGSLYMIGEVRTHAINLLSK